MSNSLNTILGLRSNVAILVYEDYNGMRICVGGGYVASNKYIIDLDGRPLKLTDEFKEFHWKQNNLELVR